MPLSIDWELGTTRHVLGQLCPAAVICDPHSFHHVKEAATAASGNSVLFVIMTGNQSDEWEGFKSPNSVTMSDLIGKARIEHPSVGDVLHRCPDAIHTLIHTSGTTGLHH